MRGTRQRALGVWSAIERACKEDDFRPNPSSLCRFCAFQDYCPAFGGDPSLAAAALGDCGRVRPPGHRQPDAAALGAAQRRTEEPVGLIRPFVKATRYSSREDLRPVARQPDRGPHLLHRHRARRLRAALARARSLADPSRPSRRHPGGTARHHRHRDRVRPRQRRGEVPLQKAASQADGGSPAAVPPADHLELPEWPRHRCLLCRDTARRGRGTGARLTTRSRRWWRSAGSTPRSIMPPTSSEASPSA